MGLAFRPAAQADIPLLRDLAERIWRVSYAAMLSSAQIDYMLGWMYAPDTITAELESGTRWIVVEDEGRPAGYLSLSIHTGKTAELHKVYLLPQKHGSGVGQEMLLHARDLAIEAKCSELRLRVNKTNARALRSYEMAGFLVVDAIVADIGGGFVMDDYVLSLRLTRGS